MLRGWKWGSAILLAALGFSQLDLNAVDTVHAIDEENQYEDERNLSSCEPSQAGGWTSAELPSCHIVASL